MIIFTFDEIAWPITKRDFKLPSTFQRNLKPACNVGTRKEFKVVPQCVTWPNQGSFCNKIWGFLLPNVVCPNMTSWPRCLQQQDAFSPDWHGLLSVEGYLIITALRPWGEWLNLWQANRNHVHCHGGVTQWHGFNCNTSYTECFHQHIFDGWYEIQFSVTYFKRL